MLELSLLLQCSSTPVWLPRNCGRKEMNFLSKKYKKSRFAARLSSSSSDNSIAGNMQRQNMGEIDTKSIESVQVALSLFEEKTDQRKSRSTSSDPELEKEQELEGLQKDLANCKVQLEAKHSAHMQALLKLDQYQKTADELSVSLRNSEAERDEYMNECIKCRALIDDLENKMKELHDQLLEGAEVREQLLCALSESKTEKEELLQVETELVKARESELKAMTQAELMETAVNMERDKADELLNCISELNEAILYSKLVASEAEKVNSAAMTEKEVELQLLTTTLAQTQEQLEQLRKQTEVVQFLENELLAKSVFIETLQFELKEANELQSLSEKAACDAISNLDQLNSDLERRERENSAQALSIINSLETEVKLLKIELQNANEEVGNLKCDVDMLTRELEKAKVEVDDIRGRENEAQVEIALLKSELHKGRSKIAAAEAAEVRAESVKSELYLAVQQLAVEAKEAKKESRRLKQTADEAKDMTGEIVSVNSKFEDSSQDLELCQTVESNEEAMARKDDHITISLIEYESLISNAKKADQSSVLLPENPSKSPTSENRDATEVLKELEFAMGRIAELRTRAEQAASRAEMAEKAKAALEGQLRHWREQRQRRRAALAALREQSVREDNNIPNFEQTPRPYQPLSTVLNMKF